MTITLWLLLYFCNAIRNWGQKAITSQEEWLIFFEENNYIDEALDMWHHAPEIVCNRSDVRFAWFYSQALAKPNKEKILRVGASLGIWVIEEYENTKTRVQSIVNSILDCRNVSESNIVCFGIVDMNLEQNLWWLHSITGTHGIYLPYMHPFTKLERADERSYYFGPLELQGIGKQKQKHFDAMRLSEFSKSRDTLPVLAMDGKYVIVQDASDRLYIAKGKTGLYRCNGTCAGGGFEFGKKLIKLKLVQWTSPFEDLCDRAATLISQNNQIVPKEYIKQIHKKTKEMFEERIRQVEKIKIEKEKVMTCTITTLNWKQYEKLMRNNKIDKLKSDKESSKNKKESNQHERYVKLNNNTKQHKINEPYIFPTDLSNKKSEVNDKLKLLNTKNIENLSNISIKKEPSKNECNDKLSDFNTQHDKESNKKVEMDRLNNTQFKKKSRKRTKKHSNGRLNKTMNDGKMEQENKEYTKSCENVAQSMNESNNNMEPIKKSDNIIDFVKDAEESSTGNNNSVHHVNNLKESSIKPEDTINEDNLSTDVTDNEEHADENTDDRNSMKESDENVNDLHPTITDPKNNFKVVSGLETQLKDTQEMLRRIIKEKEISQQNADNKFQKMEKNQRRLEKEKTKFKKRNDEILDEIDECRQDLKTLKQDQQTICKTADKKKRNQVLKDIQSQNITKNKLKLKIDEMKTKMAELKNEIEELEVAKRKLTEDRNFTRTKILTDNGGFESKPSQKKYYFSNHEKWEARLREKEHFLINFRDQLEKRKTALEAIETQNQKEFMEKGSMQAQMVEQFQRALWQGYWQGYMQATEESKNN